MDSRFNLYPQHQHQQQQQQQQTTRPSYPQAPSPQAMHSNFQSSASLSSLGSISTSPSQTSMHSRQSPIMSSAPLPSPSAERQAPAGNYFGMSPASSMQAPALPFQQLPNSFAQHPQQSDPGQHQGQRGDAGGMPETAPYLQGFNLLAEAAKRAEMAVLMRDLNDFEM